MEVGVYVPVETGVLLVRSEEIEILVLALVIRLMDENRRILMLIGGTDLGDRPGVAVHLVLAGGEGIEKGLRSAVHDKTDPMKGEYYESKGIEAVFDQI